ncbi:MAG: glycosyl hydrolase 115 family protein, partial [Lachnospiraceae bacterium]|nr:glycosyl hydrolase 115 family protein [Lachnospiraceae bacterium]
MGFLIEKGRSCRILLRDTEPEAVKIAVENLKVDLVKVFDEDILVECITSLADQIAKNNTLNKTAMVQIETLAWSGCRKEEYRLNVRDGVLYITGADRRGTIYGIYEFSEMLGVSPWYFWADVPVKTKDSFRLPEGYEKCDAPSIEYRGIFINDEEELDRWVQAHMGEDTIGVRTYEKIFELLLRLKANYIWPAMHVN